MNILVCVKQVPNTEELKVNPDAGTSNLDSIPRIVNTFDAFALETAVRLKDADPAVNIIAATIGIDKAKDALKSCLSVGANKAYLLCDGAFEGIDSLAKSKVLAQGVKEIEKREGLKFDLVFLGRQSLDGDSGHVGPQVAELLDYPQLTYACEVSLAGDKVRTKRETEDGFVVVDAALPAVVTVTKTEYEPRLPTIKAKMAATKAEIPILSAADLGIEAAAIGAKAVTVKTYIPQRKTGGIKIAEETAELAADKLASLLSGAGVI